MVTSGPRSSVKMDIAGVKISLFIFCLLAVFKLNTAKYPFQDPTLPWQKRVDDLVGRLSLDEIVGQTMYLYSDQGTPAIDRLGIKPYVWITECLRGQVKTNTTAFPQALGMSAAFSPELMYNISSSISYQARAHWNANSKAGVYKTFMGISCLSPNINIMRHPLWGRNQETYGEDPYLTGQLAAAFVKGLQGEHPRYLRVSGCCKHVDAYNGPENIPTSRMSFDAKVPTRDLRMTFLPQFRECVKAGVYNLMCSYNSVNGVPSCANPLLMTDIARKEWNFTGFFISDAGAVRNIITRHKYLKYKPETAAASIKAGCNLELGSSIFNSTQQAVKAGNLTEAEVRESIKSVFYVRMRLGEFDPPEMNPYNKIDMSVVQSEQSRILAIKAAMQSFVLLKNQNGALPIQKKNFQKIAVVGPFGNDLPSIYGDYASDIVKQYAMTPYDGLKPLSTSAVFAAGCDDVKCRQYNATSIQDAVHGSQLIVVCLGLGGVAQESESNDRADLSLPGRQLDLLKDTVRYSAGIPVILLLFNADPLDITWAKLTPGVDAILACGYPAQATGQALYHTLTMSDGPDSVPAGRLTATWPAFLNQVPPITNYNMTGHTYRYYIGEPLYPFGYGLSYTTFHYNTISVTPAQVKAGQDVRVTVTLQNTGSYDADEIVQLYMSWADPSLPAPKLQLVGFSRQRIAHRASAQVTLQVTGHQMALWMDDVSGFQVPAGTMLLFAGGQQPHQTTVAPSNILTTHFVIT